jgi:hypothetical protein
LTTKLDDLELVVRKADDSKGTVFEIRSVEKLSLLSERNLASNKTLSAYGGTLADKGGNAVRIEISGKFVGQGALQGITELRKKYKEGKPIEILSDLALLAGINKVVMEELHIEGTSGLQGVFDYSMVLRQYVPPPIEHDEGASSQNKAAEKVVDNEADIEDIRGQVLDLDGNLAKGKKVTIKGPSGEKQVVTDDNGYYEVLEVEEGKYEVTVNEEGYESQKREFEIKKKGSNA